MNGDKLAQFAGQNYLNLESYRKDGTAVCTPVWFAEGDGLLYVYTLADSYKVKRIRNNPRVRVAPCNFKGALKGEWVPAQARILDEAGARRAHELLDRKYWFSKRIGNLMARLRGYKRAEIAIQLD